MIDYIGVSDIRRLIDEIGVAPFIERLALEIEADYRRWPAFDKEERVASHSAIGVIELMPISDGRRYSFKYVNGHPRNTAEGLLTVTAFGVLADVATGYPLLLSELTVTTALRTAAMSALAARRHFLQDLIGQRGVAALTSCVEQSPELRPAQGGEVDFRHRRWSWARLHSAGARPRQRFILTRNALGRLHLPMAGRPQRIC